MESRRRLSVPCPALVYRPGRFRVAGADVANPSSATNLDKTRSQREHARRKKNVSMEFTHKTSAWSSRRSITAPRGAGESSQEHTHTLELGQKEDEKSEGVEPKSRCHLRYRCTSLSIFSVRPPRRSSGRTEIGPQPPLSAPLQRPVTLHNWARDVICSKEQNARRKNIYWPKRSRVGVHDERLHEDDGARS